MHLINHLLLIRSQGFSLVDGVCVVAMEIYLEDHDDFQKLIQIQFLILATAAEKKKCSCCSELSVISRDHTHLS